jgi:DHA2 family multidrug resistance protein-like MFS transporter
VAIYRGGLAPGLLAGLPSDVATAARDTLGGAVGVASALPAGMAEELLAEARAAFVGGMHVAAAIAGVVGVGLAAFAYITLRERGTERSATEPTCVEPTMIDQPVLSPVAKPARECF